LFKNKFIPDI